MIKKDNNNKGGVDFLANYLAVSVSAIYAAMRRGDPLPPCVQIGTRKIWRSESIDRWLESNETTPRPDSRRSEGGSKGGRPKVNTPRRGRPTKQEQIEGRQ